MLIREEALSRRFHGNSNSNDKLLFDPDAQPEKQFRVDKGMVDSIKNSLLNFYENVFDHSKHFLAPFGRIWLHLAKISSRNY